MRTVTVRVFVASLFLILSAVVHLPEAKAAEFHRNLSVGDRGPDVVLLQKRLIDLRYLAGKPTGVFGQLTFGAVTRFERALGFFPDGVVTEKEWMILFPPPIPTATVKINGKVQTFSQPPVIINSSTLVPFRGILEALGAEVRWDGGTRTITAIKGDVKVVLQIGAQAATKNGVPITLTQPALIVNNVAMVPVRFIGQTFADSVDWDGVTRTVLITAASITPAPVEKLVFGYYPIDYPGDKKAYNSLLSFGQSLGAIGIFSLLLDGKYNFTGSLPVDEISTANKLGVKGFLVVHNYRNGGFDRNIIHNLLNNPGAWDKFIGDILKLVKTNGLSGVNVDFENIPPGDRNHFGDFLRALAAALKPGGFLVTVAVPAKTFNDLQNTWSGAFDYKLIGQLSDYVIIMTYDQHWYGGSPGPVASLSWVKKVLDYAVTCVPKEKLLLGIPTYGYDWSPQGAKVVRWNQVTNLLAKYGKEKVVWDTAAATPYLRYEEAGVKHEVWFENQYSLKPKLDLAIEYGVAGLSIWRLGFEDSSFWETLKRYFLNN